MTDGGHLIPLSVEPIFRQQVRKLAWFAPFSEEGWVDAGHEPPPGYWLRQEKRQIASRSLRARFRRARYRLTAEPSRRISHAIAALRGMPSEWCEADEL